MLSENELASRIGVSRTPVRSALLRLQDEGWITVYPQRGALVREIGADEANNIADARHFLELTAVRRVSEGVRESLASTLDATVDEQEARLDDGSLDSFVDLDIDFHRELVAAAGNPVILEFYDRLRDRQSLMIARGLSTTGDRARRIIDEHRGLIRHIRDGQWRELDDALRSHLLATHGALFSDR
ncbi:hypothetical protein ASE16_02350 [Leifsonia sp. Root227]|nr:hypothetical protein ASE16_02350 [Leifsonia sp. Root227]